jgi:hypothetical protein
VLFPSSAQCALLCALHYCDELCLLFRLASSGLVSWLMDRSSGMAEAVLGRGRRHLASGALPSSCRGSPLDRK